MNNVLCTIAANKNMTVDDDVKQAICISCNGDLKKLFNIMQLLSGIHGIVSLDSFYRLVDIPSYECIKNLLLCCEQHDLKSAFEKLNEILSNGYDSLDILDIIEKTLLYIDVIQCSFDIEKQNHMLSVVTQCIMFKKHTRIQLYNMVREMCLIA